MAVLKLSKRAQCKPIEPIHWNPSKRLLQSASIGSVVLEQVQVRFPDRIVFAQNLIKLNVFVTENRTTRIDLGIVYSSPPKPIRYALLLMVYVLRILCYILCD